MTPAELNGLERLHKAATQGEWTHESPAWADSITVDGHASSVIAVKQAWMDVDGSGRWEKAPNAEANFALIVAAVNALPGLIETVRRLTKLHEDHCGLECCSALEVNGE